MALANKTFISNGGSVGISSILPDGDAAPPTTGLKIVGTVANGNVVTIMSGSDVDFGNIAPDFFFIMKMENMTAGQNLVLTKGSTFDSGYVARKQEMTYSTVSQAPIHSVASMPYGKGIPYGDLVAYPNSGQILNAKMETRSIRKYSSFYRFTYIQWPASNQANQLANHAGSSEQVKAFGDQFEDGFSRLDQTKIDVYQGICIANSNNGDDMSNSQALGVSNSGSFGGTQTSDLGANISGGFWYFPGTTNNASAVVSGGITYPANTNLNYYIDNKHSRSNMMCYETFIVSGESAIRSDIRMIDVGLGVVCDIHDTADRNVNCLNTKFDRFDTPKNVQGYNIPDNKHFYVNGTIQFISDVEGVASCRVMIANTPTPTKDTTKLSACIPIYWSSHLLKIQIVVGMFEGLSLTGNYLHIYGAFNAYKGAILIP